MPEPPRLSVRDTGSGPALLLLHAFPLDASQWDEQVARLSGRFRCLRPDMWGCGSTAPHPQSPTVTLDEYAGAVLAEMDARAIAEFIVLGSSMGGYTAYALWRRAADRMRGLVLSSARAGADNAEQRDARETMAERVLSAGVESIVQPTLARLLSPGSLANPEIADRLRACIRRCTAQGIVACQTAMAARPDSTPLLSGIGVPTLVVTGDQDAVVTVAELETVADLIPDAQMVVLPGLGHLPNLENAAMFDAPVATFLEPIRRAMLPLRAGQTISRSG